jgi:arylformamidase
MTELIYDITRTISPELKVWPGDTPFHAHHVLRRSEGAAVNLTTLTLSAHTGTHADAYYHYEDEPLYTAHMPLTAYIGAARVISVSRQDGALLPSDFVHSHIEGAQRLLIHSYVSDLPDNQWPQTFPYLSVVLVEWLAGLGIRLIGLDSPSVDAFDSTDLPCHHALRRHNMVNLESLCLRDVSDGDYELIALPLKIDGVCGSPVRAILRRV